MKILGFDIGVTSIGWAYVEDDELKDCGVRIFTKAENPKTGESLALPRREARSARRTLARRKVRLNAIKRLLCKEFGFNLEDYLSNDGELPRAYQTSKDTKSPYELRTLALEQKLEPKDLARVILHIAKHRGYGNKHAKNSNDDESGKVKKAISANEKIIKEKGYQSVGEYFYKEFYQNGLNVRNKGENYKHCISQGKLKEELEKIFKRQKAKGFPFSNNTYKSMERDENNKYKEVDFETAIMEIAFYQRDLKDFSDKVGFCIFFEDKKRASKESLSAKEFIALTRIINTLKNIGDKIKQVYDKEKIQEILNFVLDEGAISYAKLREFLKLDEKVLFRDTRLSYEKGIKEAEKVKFIEFKELKKLKKALGGSFEGLERKHIDEIAKKITLIKSKENLKKELEAYIEENQLEQRLNKCLEHLSELDFSRHINLSLEALEKILPFMRNGLGYDEAVEKAGLQEHRKHKEKGAFLTPLKDYEPYLANPVVARALSQYRKILNALIKKYEKVHKIHIEFTREAKLNKKEKKEKEKEQRENFNINKDMKDECEKLGLLPINGKNILKMKLWREQEEYCVYSGEKITIDHLKDPTMLEIDHIYPRSRSFDDSYMNKVLCFTKENREKINKTPFEAFGSNKEKWEKIVSFVQKLPYKKRKRILNTHFDQTGFIARNLNDTGYIARLARQWTNHSLDFLPLSENEVSIAGEKGSKKHIEVISGSITAMLRHYWGLGDKDRNTHLHHAIDAVIIAYTNAKMIKAFADYRKTSEQNKAKLYAKEIEESEYEKQKAFHKSQVGVFRQKVLEKVNTIFVSKPPRKKARGALHEETFYSFNDKKLLKDYGGKKGIERALSLGKIRQIGTKIVSNGTMVRVDIFKDQKGKFYGVPIYTMDFALGILPNKAVVNTSTEYKKKNKDIKDWVEMVDSEYEFCFSLFKDDLILIQKKEMQEAELCYFVSFNTSTASICVTKHNNKFEDLSENEKLLYSNATPEEVVGKGIGIQNLKVFEKYQISSLGEYQKADFEPRKNISLKTMKRKNGI